MPVDATYWVIPGYLIFWVLFFVAFGLFAQRVFALLRVLLKGRRENRFDVLATRVKFAAAQVFLQRCSLNSVKRGDLAGVGHLVLFWGFCLFSLGYVVFTFLGGGLGYSTRLESSVFGQVFSFVLDVSALLVVAAVVWAAVRRYVVRPSRIEASAEAGVVLGLVFLLMILHLIVEGFGYAVRGDSSSWVPIGAAVAYLISASGISPGVLGGLHKGLWWFHYAMVLGFLVYVPRSKHLHILAAPANILFRNVGPKGRLRDLDIEKDQPFGATMIEDFTWKQLLDQCSCTTCGRCQDACPAVAAGKALNPKKVVRDIKSLLLESRRTLQEGVSRCDVASRVGEEPIWDCTTCGVCQEVCPVCIEHVENIVDMRRSLVEKRRVFGSGSNCLESMHLLGNPYGSPGSERSDWSTGTSAKVAKKESNPEYVYWIGCSGAYDPLCQTIARTMVRILNSTGIDYAILGVEERCCGDPARRLGEEGLFQELACKNISVLRKYGANKIVTHCPHCLNTLKNEYPRFGGNFEVVHHSQLLSDLLGAGKLKPRSLTRTVTFHDPCYLGRYNNIFEPARRILSSIPSVTLSEMERNREMAFCCGGGGGQMWISTARGKRINHIRFQEAGRTKAQTLVTACPFCKIMLADSSTALAGDREHVPIMDIAELI